MKTGIIAAAFPAVQRLMQRFEDDYDITYKIYRLKVEMKTDADYFAEKHLEILKKHGKETKPGVFEFRTVTDKLMLNSDLEALNEVESKVIFEKLCVPKKGLKITGADIEALEPFIDFVDEKEA